MYTHAHARTHKYISIATKCTYESNVVLLLAFLPLPLPLPSPVQGFDPQAILDDMRKLKLIVKAHERRIKSLEEKLAQYESEEEIEQDA